MPLWLKDTLDQSVAIGVILFGMYVVLRSGRFLAPRIAGFFDGQQSLQENLKTNLQSQTTILQGVAAAQTKHGERLERIEDAVVKPLPAGDPCLAGPR